jgi:hypothetical protein
MQGRIRSFVVRVRHTKLQAMGNVHPGGVIHDNIHKEPKIPPRDHVSLGHGDSNVQVRYVGEPPSTIHIGNPYKVTVRQIRKLVQEQYPNYMGPLIVAGKDLTDEDLKTRSTGIGTIFLVRQKQRLEDTKDVPLTGGRWMRYVQ